MQVIGLTGMPGSGKTEFAKLSKRCGAQVIRMGDLVWEEVKKRGLELTDSKVGLVATELRRENPMVWAERTTEQIKIIGKEEHPKIFVIDGIRSQEEVEYFRKSFQRFTLIAIHSSQKTRLNRLSTRNRKDDIHSMEELKSRDKRELGWGLGEVIALADTILINEGTLSEFRKKTKKILNEINQINQD
jgi:dephospho-CoA kinase